MTPKQVVRQLEIYFLNALALFAEKFGNVVQDDEKRKGQNGNNKSSHVVNEVM